MHGPHFSANPIGVESTPRTGSRDVARGEAAAAFLVRDSDEPVSPVRGAAMA